MTVSLKEKYPFFLLLILFFSNFSLLAASKNTDIQKIKEKGRKEILKKHKKEDWKVVGSAISLENAFNNYWQKTDVVDQQEIVGYCASGKTLEQALKMAATDANAVYVQTAIQTVEAKVKSTVSSHSASGNSFSLDSSREAESRIKGNLKKIFSIYRKNPDGSYEIKSFFLAEKTPE